MLLLLIVASVDKSVRLSDGRNELEGRVEVCMDGVWGTVCNDPWSMENTAVVCSQLGFGKWNETSCDPLFLRCCYHAVYVEILCCIGNRGYYINRLAVGIIEVPILLAGVQCHGNESQLVGCLRDGALIRKCNHNEDVRVVCIPIDTPPGKENRQQDLRIYTLRTILI